MTGKGLRSSVRRQSWTTWVLIGSLGIVALALLVVPGLIAPAPDARPTSQAPSPTVVVSFPASAFRSVEWRISRLGSASENAIVTQLVLVRDRLVAIGSRGGAPVAWWSDDGGVTWTTATSISPPGPPRSDHAVAAPRTAAASGQRLVAAGFWMDPTSAEILGPVVWTSEDGRTWEGHDLVTTMRGATLDDLVGTPDGFYAIGQASDTQRWWFSKDGVSWRQIEPVGLPVLTIFPPAVAWSPELFLVAGGHGSGRVARPGIWVASDGLVFEEAFDDEDSFGWITSLAHADYGFVAAGQTVDDADDPTKSHVAAWISVDGRAWQPLIRDAPSGTGAGTVAANSSGAVIIGWSTVQAQLPEVWFLPGGAGLPSTVRFPFLVQDLVALPDRFVAIGRCPPDEGCDGLMIAIGYPSALPNAPDPTLPEGN